MQLIELHILQSFPVSCLNRDDVGAPKTAVFGGVNRARLSSQSLKRAIRLQMHEHQPNLFAGERSKLIIQPLAERIEALGISKDAAWNAARATGIHLAGLDAEAAAKGVEKVKTVMFFSPKELDGIASALASALNEDVSIFAPKPEDDSKKKKGKAGGPDMGKLISKACAGAALKDAADIALFGRMVASDHSLTLEGAAMFGHALSTHHADNDLDFFTAVDDRQRDDPTIADSDRAGSGMMGHSEFTSAVYYRYAALNLKLLSEHHLKELSPEQRRAVVDAFIRATLMAVPGARQNSMNAHTLPGYVLGTYKSAGQPVQLINAFESPVRAKSGLLQTSVEALKAHHEDLKKTWDIRCETEVAMPEVPLAEFCAALTGHVR